MEERRKHRPETSNTGASALRGEDLKASERGIEAARCLANFGETDGSHAREFKTRAADGVYSPSTQGLLSCQLETDRLLQSGDVQVLIPMHESGDHDVPAPVLDYLLEDCRIPREFILVVNHLSGEAAVRRVVERSIPMVDALEVMACLDPALCHIAHLPELRTGKGIAVLAGLLALKAMAMDGAECRFRWIMMHDSELIHVHEYNGARYLSYPLVVDGDPHNMVLACQSGRNNEAVHCARVATEADAIFNPIPQIAEYARVIGPRLTKLSWMLCGERILDAETLFRLPLTTGYALETILNFGVEGVNAFGNTRKTTAQVINPNGRIDACSGEYAEQFMMNMIGRAMRAFILMGTPPHTWNLQDIARLNAGFAQMHVIPAIAEFSGPVTCRETPADRVLPSVKEIIFRGWVDAERMRKCVPHS